MHAIDTAQPRHGEVHIRVLYTVAAASNWRYQLDTQSTRNWRYQAETWGTGEGVVDDLDPQGRTPHSPTLATHTDNNE
jgi:hypothetical protein